MMRPTVLALLLAFAGCESTPAVGPESSAAYALTSTDRAEYELSSDATEPLTIRLVFSNRTHDTVWIIHCGGPRPDLERRVGDEWVTVQSGVGLDCLQTARVEAGEQLRTDYTVRAEFLETAPITGTYRVVWREAVWNFETDTDTSVFGDLLPLEQRVSNEFSLRRLPD